MNLLSKSTLLVLFIFLFTMAASATDEKKNNYPDYKKYITSPAELNFEPQDYLFGSLVKILHTQYYGDVSEQNMIESVVSEINRLCKEAGQKSSLSAKTFTTPIEVYNTALLNNNLPKNLIKYAAIMGLMKSTGDPYTSFLTPKEQQILMENLQSYSFGGIGVVIELDKNNGNELTIIEPIEDSPAYKAGIKAGDIITEIDSKTTKGVDIDISSSRLRGNKGTTVIITIKRKGVAGSRKYTIIRDTISVKSIAHKVINNNIGYIKLRSFGERTNKEFQESLADLMAQGIKGLIIDLRNNGGGYVNAAIKISDTFLGNKARIVSIKNKRNSEVVQNSENISPNKLPVIILVNKYSASASEITAGAFQDNKRAELVGTKTFGKGSVQQVVPLSDGSAIKITIAHYHTPNGSDINKKGLEPDYNVEMDAKDMGTEKDKQLQKAIELLKSKG